jgi:Ca2+-transporting ATPase
VVLTEMVIDPVCSLAFEGTPEDPRVMQRPPRRPDDSIVGWPMLWQALLQGGGLLAITLAVYAVSLECDRTQEQARTLAVLGLTAGNLLLVWVNASAGLRWRAMFGSDFRAFWVVAAVASAALAAAIALPAPRELLHFGVPTWVDMSMAMAAVTGAVLLSAIASRRVRHGAIAATAHS